MLKERTIKFPLGELQQPALLIADLVAHHRLAEFVSKLRPSELS